MSKGAFQQETWRKLIRHRQRLTETLMPIRNRQYIFQQRALKRAEGITAPSKDLFDICTKKGVSKENFYLIGMPGIDISKYENPSPIVIDDLMPIPQNIFVLFQYIPGRSFYDQPRCLYIP